MASYAIGIEHALLNSIEHTHIQRTYIQTNGVVGQFIDVLHHGKRGYPYPQTVDNTNLYLGHLFRYAAHYRLHFAVAHSNVLGHHSIFGSMAETSHSHSIAARPGIHAFKSTGYFHRTPFLGNVGDGFVHRAAVAGSQTS